MPIEFTHLLSGVIVLGIYWAAKKPVPLTLLSVGLIAFLLPDLDHLLYWEPYMAGLLFPLSLTDLFSGFSLRHPSYLHLWLFPAALILAAFLMRRRANPYWKYIAIVAVGWTVHLA
ncbi:MAG: hypothetical protein LUP94_00520, partial [Candidatus Methanomethylicus sp.]|nr:hypothetical protein [Candidatus Methanomethylicus sp.]